ncbi:DUF1707 SHOCT-like domain-containing protein [Nocardia vermiculata]|uniref:DUF1707 domain-containing protein n=1 Tax=Nocardia vermiculata TaxID=257274 RepID=A0A846Y3I6_9NOCA|nr:DUF1707 domain-containing protein [Nocardia vermiculata]NKY52510.1 DUF1707 domain-containing protein [Nocardia vermiculata]
MDKSANKGRRPRAAERLATRLRLDAARDAGRLSETDHAARTARATRVRTIGDLRALTSDLRDARAADEAERPVRPPGPPPTGRPSPSGVQPTELGPSAGSSTPWSVAAAPASAVSATAGSTPSGRGEAGTSSGEPTTSGRGEPVGEGARAESAASVADPVPVRSDGTSEGRASWVRGPVGVVVAVLIAIVGVWVIATNPFAADETSARPELPDMTTAAGVDSFLGAYREHFGDLLADEVTFHPTHVSIVRAVAGDPAQAERYSYDGEFDTWSNPDDRDPELAPIDLGVIDIATLGTMLADAPRTVGAPGTTLSHVILERSPLSRDREPLFVIYPASGGFWMVTTAGESVYVSSFGS